jgi:hypothetical protein
VISAREGTPVGHDGTFDVMVAVTGTQVAERFLDALAALDFDVAAALFADDGRLRALVPQAVREDEGPEAIANRFRFWWDALEDLELVERHAERFHDRTAIRYRWRGRDADDGWVEVEQSGYFRLGSAGEIVAMNVADSGFIPVA